MSALQYKITVVPIYHGGVIIHYFARCTLPAYRVSLTGRTHHEALMRVVEAVLKPV